MPVPQQRARVERHRQPQPGHRGRLRDRDHARHLGQPVSQGPQPRQGRLHPKPVPSGPDPPRRWPGRTHLVVRVDGAERVPQLLCSGEAVVALFRHLAAWRLRASMLHGSHSLVTARYNGLSPTNAARMAPRGHDRCFI
jgi:hypothetical protein